MKKNLVALEYLFIILSITQNLHQLNLLDINSVPNNSAEFSVEELLVLEKNVYSYHAQYGNAPVPIPPRPRYPRRYSFIVLGEMLKRLRLNEKQINENLDEVTAKTVT